MLCRAVEHCDGLAVVPPPTSLILLYLYMPARFFSSLFLVLLLSDFFTGFSIAAAAQAYVQGQWTTLSSIVPINPIHAVLLSTGQVLVVAGSGNCPPSQTGCPSGPPYGPANGSG